MAKNDVLKYKPGVVIQFSHGEYSSYGMVGLVVTLKECDLPALAQQYVGQRKAAIAAGKEYREAEPENFPSWLITNGYVMPVDYQEVHLGGYQWWHPEFGIN